LKLFFFSPAQERHVSDGKAGDPKDPSKKLPLSKRSMYGTKGSGLTNDTMDRDGYLRTE